MKTLCKAGARITALAAVFVALFGGCTDIYIRDAALSSNALLARLSVKHGETELAPGFQPEVFEYTGAVLYPVETLTISAECADSKAALSYSANVADGIVTLARGANCVVVTVTAENGAVQEYVAHINVISSNALLARLSVQNGETELTPGFQPDVFEYANTVLYPVETLTISAECADSGAMLSYSANVADGIVTLARGAANRVVVTVTAEDGATQEYVVNINAAGPKWFDALAFEPSNNPGVSSFDMSFNEDAAVYTFTTLQFLEHIDSLKPSFYSDGVVTVGGAVQTSGVSAQDFRHEVVYTVTVEGVSKDFQVKLETPQTTGLPVMRIDTQGGVGIVSKDEYVRTNIALYDPDNSAYTFTNTEFKDKIRGRGNATWSYPKKPYKIKLDKKTDMLGMGSDKDWVLLANYCDKTLLRTAIAFKTSELLDFPWTPKARFVELFINGEYMGNYNLVEGIKQGSSRVDIPETGYLIERDGYYAAEPVYFMSNGGNPYTFKNPDPDGDLTDEQLDYIHTYMNEFEQVLESDDFNDPVNGYSKYIDTDSFARWFVFQNILANIDTNVYVTKDDDTAASKLFMGPVWDFEWSIGIGWYEGARPRPADYWVWNSWYYSKLLTDSAFIERVKAIWNQYKTLIRAEITASMDRMKNTLINSQKVNFRRWDILNRRISVGGIPLGSFEAEVACDRQFFIDHMDWLDGAINSE